MRNSLSTSIVILMLSVFTIGTAMANGEDHRCQLGLLDGLYVFTASGFNIPSGAPPVPKAIIEVLRFHGDGTVETLTVALNVNGNPSTNSPGGTGTYTVSALDPPEAVYTGTLAFNDPPNPRFNLVIALKVSRSG
jgi:hypothetical protein